MRKIELLTYAAVLALCCISLNSCGDKNDNPVSPQPTEKRYVLAEMTESSDEANIIVVNGRSQQDTTGVE